MLPFLFDSLGDLEKINFSKKFVFKQIQNWLYQKRNLELENFSDLSLSDKNLIKEKIQFRSLKISKKVTSSKSLTTKYIFQTHDNHFIESVAIADKNNSFTLCISSQIGCSYACQFCATGRMKLIRNLTVHEIVEQFIVVNYTHKIKNIVFMGMGEPFHNSKNVFGAIQIFTKQLSLSPKRISISTSGVVSGINRLVEKKLKVNLCISLHSTVQKIRDKIMPDLKKIPLLNLQEALINYYEKIKNPILIEYIMIKNINDSKNDLFSLINFLKKFSFIKTNLIAYNKIGDDEYMPSDAKNINEWLQILKSKGLHTVQRYKKGDDIAAACGQLFVSKNIKK